MIQKMNLLVLKNVRLEVGITSIERFLEFDMSIDHKEILLRFWVSWESKGDGQRGHSSQ